MESIFTNLSCSMNISAVAVSLIISSQTVNFENYTLPLSNQVLKFELAGHLLKLDGVEGFTVPCSILNYDLAGVSA